MLARDVCREPHCDKMGHTAQSGPAHAGSICLPPASRSAAGFFLAPAHRDGTGNVHRSFAGACPVGGPPRMYSGGGQRLIMSGWAKKKSTSLTAIKVASYLPFTLSPSLPRPLCPSAAAEYQNQAPGSHKVYLLIPIPKAGTNHRSGDLLLAAPFSLLCTYTLGCSHVDISFFCCSHVDISSRAPLPSCKHCRNQHRTISLPLLSAPTFRPNCPLVVGSLPPPCLSVQPISTHLFVHVCMSLVFAASAGVTYHCQW